jgi:aldehyde dehydrogenase (NAD+)
MTFRTPDEAVAIANNSRFGLAASVWSENVNVTLDIAAKLKAGVVWINSTNMFDAAAGFGGYRESGYGREGGREGMAEYLKPIGDKPLKADEKIAAKLSALPVADEEISGLPSIDRTAKLYVGGKQARPDSGYSYTVLGPKGQPISQAGLGNRKDIRNAVEAAGKAGSWGGATAHNRAQVLYYVAENLSSRAKEFEARIVAMTGVSAKAAAEEVAVSIRRTFWYAAQADKFDGAVHATKSRHVTLAMNEAFGNMGILCPDEAPLLGFVSLVMPAISMGNRVIVVPSSSHPLAATDFYQILDTSDVPAGVVNIVTGERDVLAKTLAEHDDVAALWYFGSKAGSAMVEKASAWQSEAGLGQSGHSAPLDREFRQGREFLRRATQVKNIWIALRRVTANAHLRFSFRESERPIPTALEAKPPIDHAAPPTLGGTSSAGEKT